MVRINTYKSYAFNNSQSFTITKLEIVINTRIHVLILVNTQHGVAMSNTLWSVNHRAFALPIYMPASIYQK